jgi:predicted nucleic acid-binding Zn ribbon protein
MRRAGPRPLAESVMGLAESLAPVTPLARVQRVWAEAVGEAIAREAEPVSERAGVVTIGCRSAVWAQELDLLAPDLIERLNEALGDVRVGGLRCVSSGGRITP